MHFISDDTLLVIEKECQEASMFDVRSMKVERYITIPMCNNPHRIAICQQEESPLFVAEEYAKCIRAYECSHHGIHRVEGDCDYSFPFLYKFEISARKMEVRCIKTAYWSENVKAVALLLRDPRKNASFIEFYTYDGAFLYRLEPKMESVHISFDAHNNLYVTHANNSISVWKIDISH